MTREEAIMVLEMVDAYGLADEAKKMAISALSAEPKVAYACDGRRCGADCSDCGRTTDIEHAKNFTKVCDSYFEKLQTEPSDLISKAGAIAALEKLYQYEELEIQNAKDMPYKYTDTFVESTEWKKAGIAHAIRELYDVPSIPSAARPTHDYITESANDVVEKNDEVIERPIIEHDREWIIGCIKHDGFIKTDRFDKANQIILDALADRPSGEWLDVNGDGSLWECTNCHDKACCKGNFCSECGAKMKGGGE